MTTNALVIGTGGIGSAIVDKLVEQGNQVFTVSRRGTGNANWSTTVHCSGIAEQNDETIKHYINGLKENNISLDKVFITTGILHDEALAKAPEKRLEDISSENLLYYFSVNSVIPMLWCKHLVGVMRPNAIIVCLSARVGSITDNQLGGWYGYRASKSALNMYVKTSSIEYRRRKKDTVFVCYHPGTVDSGLSKPFQKNVKPEKRFTPEFTVSQLFTHIDNLDRAQSCHFIDWQGLPVDW